MKNKIEHIITIDFETYYDSEYTLTNMSTSEYVADDRFEIIGVGVQVDTETPVWVSGPDFTLIKKTDFGARWVSDYLRSLPWDKSIAVAHNAMFDGWILAEWFAIRPARWFCTSMATRPLLATKLGTTSLAAVSEYFGIGQKGTEVINAKGKHRSDFTEEELHAYGEYCKNDVRLSYIIYQLMMAWYEKTNVQLA